MVHGELGTPPCEVFTGMGVCTSSMMALRYANLNVAGGERSHAVSVGSEFASRFMRSLNFEPELEARVAELEKRPEIGFEKEFLRWMLSDGAGAAMVSAEPNTDKLSLRIDWIELISFAGELPVCMYSGGQKDEEGRVRGWHELEDPLDVVRKGYHAVKQDARLLVENVMPATVGRALKMIVERRGLRPDDVTWLLPHYSSAFFRPRLHDEMAKADFAIPYERWFTNLPRVGNAGSASIYLMLEELFDSGRLQPGDRLLCYVPESARFSVAWMSLTVV
jgi:3-oxoacyl-[acyl-carrier-protein] synthase-3